METLLSRCRIDECEARCCYDGVYLTYDDEKRVASACDSDRDFFSFLPSTPIVWGDWQGVTYGRKTAVRPWSYKSDDFPSHFSQTRCVFALDDGLCSLQVFATQNNEDPWKHKPTACWLHPLRRKDSELVPPPVMQSDDPDAAPGYPGYMTFTPCGQHICDGDPWQETLSDEIEYNKRLTLPWPNG